MSELLREMHREALILFPYLDRLSRQRALSERESLILERAMKIADGGRLRQRPHGWTLMLAKAGHKRSPVRPPKPIGPKPPPKPRPAPDRSGSIFERMERALAGLAARRGSPRRAKAFYLGPEDWLDFIASDPPIIQAIWNEKPRPEPSFKGVPVRPSKNVPGRQSRLYDRASSSRFL